MALPFPIEPYKDPEWVPSRELAGFGTRTGDPGDEVPVPNRPAGMAVVPLPIFDGGTVRVLTAQPSGATDYGFAIPKYPSAWANEARLVADVETAGHTTAELFLERSATGTSGWTEPGVSGAEIAVPIASAVPVAGPWVTLDAASRADLFWRIRARGGNATLSPVIKKAHAQFRQAIATAPPRGDIGSPLLDWDASRLTGYSDGEDVGTFTDFSGNNNHGNPGGSPYLQLEGIFELDKFGTGRHAVRIDGAGDGYQSVSMPTTDSWTMFAVVGDITGQGNEGDDGSPNAIICVTPVGGPSSVMYHTIRGDGKVTTAMNGNVFDGSNQRVTTNAFSGAPLRIHKVAFLRTAGSFSVDVDGVRVITKTCAASHMTLCTSILIGNAATHPHVVTASWAELLFYPGAMVPEFSAEAAAQGDAIWAALKTKWGVS